MVTNNSCDYQPTQYNVQTGGASGTLNNVAPSATSGVPVISQGSSSQPVFGTAVVAGGGTGDTSFTAYAPICGGTTTTGALQVASTGLSTSGYVLTSNGSSALPSFQAVGVATFQVNNQVFTSSGTYTPTSGMVYCQITCIGGGGGGGGSAATTGAQYSTGAGGGYGEYAVGIFSAASIGASQTVTIGAAGASNSGAAGGAGGSTSVGILISANGGSGGATSTGATTNGAGGAGGTGGSGGDYRTAGQAGFSTWSSTNANVQFLFSGTGGSGQLGAGGQGIITNTGGANAGNAGNGHGAGGGGSTATQSQSATSGGAGTKGIVVVLEFIT